MTADRRDPAKLAEGSSLTARQIQVLRLRADGRTQREIADEFGTTASNVSRIESAAERNVERARRTLDVARLLDAPVRFQVPAGTSFDELVEAVYRRGDEAGVAVDYCRPELYSHLYGTLAFLAERNALRDSVEVGITANGDVRVVTD